MNRSIVSPSTAAVKPRRHPRIQRDDIAAQEIDPALKAFGRPFLLLLLFANTYRLNNWFLALS